ncbi:MAG: hypothetical protein GY757_17350, partial [bacterium]|nr:hypothetical protein [bacterium]
MNERVLRGGLKSLLLLMAVLLLLPALNLQAFNIGDFSFYITNEFLFNHNRLAEKKSQYYESLSIFSNYKKVSMGFTLRGNNFFKQAVNVTLEDPEFDVYRKFVQYNSKNLNVTVGDFYSMLGRGLVLSVLENQDVLRERTILGGNVHYNRGRIDLRFLGGRIKAETGSQEWNIAGGEAGFEYTKNHRAGVHF